MKQKIRFPNFTAEFSVNLQSLKYTGIAGNKFSTNSEIIPQCIKGCICVAEEGCECCDSITDIINSSKKTTLPIRF
jgi:hypothetical protein